MGICKRTCMNVCKDGCMYKSVGAFMYVHVVILFHRSWF